MKISHIQIFWMIFIFEVGNTLLLSVSKAIEYGKQDAWISFFLASLIAMAFTYIATKVGLLYPNQSLIEYSKIILGKWIGNIVVLFYLFQWYSVITVILSEFSNFTITILLHSTPMWILNLTILLLIIYVLYVGGIEGVGRCGEVFGPIVFIMLILLVILSFPNMELRKILPILSDSSFVLIAKGAIMPLSFLGESIIMLMLISFMDKPEKGTKSAVWAVAVASSIVNISAFIVISIFGPTLSTKLSFPVFDMISYISLLNFIQNLEILAVIIWMLTIFIKLSVYIFFACYGTAQFLKIKDWRKTMWFIVPIVFIPPLIYPNGQFYGDRYNEFIWNPYILPINLIGLPLLLWIIGSIRKRKSNKKAADFS